MSVAAPEREVAAPLGEQEAGAASARPGQAGLSAWFLLVGVGTFATTLGNPLIIGSLPAKVLLKEQLAATKEQMALFFLLAGTAWYIKPLFGLALDRMTGVRSLRACLAVSCAAAVGLWALLALVPVRYAPLLCLFLTLNIAVVMATNVIGGIMVARGRDRAATGRLGAASMGARNVGYMIAGPLGGVLAGQPLGMTAAVGGAIMGGLLTLALTLRNGEDAAAPRSSDPRPGLMESFANRAFWGAAAMVFLVELAPGFETPLFYMQRDELKFSTEFLGGLQLAQSLCGILAAAAFALLCRRLPLKATLAGGIILSALASLAFYAYRGPVSAMAVSMLTGVVGTLAFLPVLDLAARATPGGIACAGFALIMSMRNLSSSLSDVLGSWLNDSMGIPFRDLIWINSVTTAAALLALPLLPEAILRKKDGEKVQAA